MDDRRKVDLIITKVAKEFNSNPESKLMFAVIEQGLKDLVLNTASFDDRIDALRYLKSNMTHAEICGVSSAWIRRIITQVGLDLKKIKRETILTEAARIKAA